jgi:hypothetical protein
MDTVRSIPSAKPESSLIVGGPKNGASLIAPGHQVLPTARSLDS